MTDLLYIDDMKIFASSECKLNQVMKSTKTAMGDIGLKWNPYKSGAPNDSFLMNICSKKQTLSRIFDGLRTAKIFDMFYCECSKIYDFRVLSLTSLTIFETLEFSGIMNSLELAFSNF